jgi:glycogen debranching enzyme
MSSYSLDSSSPVAGMRDAATLVRGGTFVVCAPDGTIRAGGLQGYFAGDTRVLSNLMVTVDGHQPLVIEHNHHDVTISASGIVGDPSSPVLMIQRALTLDVEQLTFTLDVTNLTSELKTPVIEINAAADFADIFEVKRGERPRAGFVGSGPSGDDLVLAYENQDFRRGLRISCDVPQHVMRDAIRFEPHLKGHGTFRAVVSLIPEGQRYSRLHISDPSGEQIPLMELPDRWLDAAVLQNHRHVLERSCSDLESLVIPDPVQPGKPVIAAGSPWFMALFGRDSLITSWQTLALTSSLAVNTLEALAERQGTTENSVNEEQPGRILHEVRSGEAVLRPEGWGAVYYGTVDATPLFIMTLAEAFLRGADKDRIRALMPAAERALEWIQGPGDPDGDGFIEYPGRATKTGLDNQGWKDSFDAVRHRDGRLADGPIAMVEVQGYAHAALRSLAMLRETLDTGDSRDLLQRADELRDRIHEHFWMDEEDCFALALDGDKQKVASVTTNAGHLLWTGTAHAEIGPRVARRLMQDDMFTGFGLRTLSSENPAYNPLSYHCGSVWPHDTAIVGAGFCEYQQHDLALDLTHGLLDAADASGRLPELFGGFHRQEHPRPVPYPSSCSPQAWAAGAPLLLARGLLAMSNSTCPAHV